MQQNTTGEQSLRARLPHRPPALFVEGVVERTSERLVCAGRLPARAGVALGGASVSTSSLLALELAAQATALWEAEPIDHPPTTALLVSIRRAQLAAAVPCEVQLLITASSLGGAGGLRKFHCRVTTAAEPDTTLAEAELATFTAK